MCMDVASISLSRRTWSVIFIAATGYLYMLISNRSEETPGSDRWLELDNSIREALKTFFPVLKEAAENSPEMGKLFFTLKMDAGFFPGDEREDKLKQLVEFVDPT